MPPYWTRYHIYSRMTSTSSCLLLRGQRTLATRSSMPIPQTSKGPDHISRILGTGFRKTEVSQGTEHLHTLAQNRSQLRNRSMQFHGFLPERMINMRLIVCSAEVQFVSSMRFLISLCESQMTRVWHVTFKRKVPSILRQGLEPRVGKRSRSVKEKVPAIYVFPDPTSLEDALTNWLGDEIPDAKLSILELIVPEDWINHDNLRWEARILRPVPPNMIKVVVPDIDDWTGPSNDWFEDVPQG